MIRTPLFRALAILATALILGLALPAAAQSPLQPAGDAASDSTDPALSALIDALEDPETRQRLIEAIRTAEAGPASDVPPAEGTEEITFAANVAAQSQRLVGELFAGASAALRDVGRLANVPALLTPERWSRIADEGVSLLLTVLTTVLIYRALRMVSRRVRYSGDRDDAFLAQAGTFAVQFVLRALSVLVAWLIGYALAGTVFGDDGPLLSQALYLNAFLIVGAFSVLLSIFVSHHPEDLTFAHLPVAAEATIYKTIRRTFGLLCYGIVAVVPITQDWLNFVAARSLRTIIVTLGALTALYAVHRIARVIRKERAKQAERATQASDTDDSLSGTIASSSITLWDRFWPALGYLYVLISYGIAMANPTQMVELVGRATVFTALGLIALLFALRVFAQVGRERKAPVPQALASALPPLQDRLTTFVPFVIVLTGLALVVLAVALTLEGWRLIDLSAWVANGGSDFLWRLASIVLIALILVVGWAVLSAWIDHRLSTELPEKQVSARSRTLLALFRNAVTIALVIFGGMTILSELGIDIAPLLAGAGVIGLAIGFGAQKLVQDIITGIFIQLENAINEGDVVTVAGVTGGVEKLTIRSVGLRDLAGVYHLIPFSAVDTVSNFMRKFAYHVEVVGVAYDSDLDTVEAAMREAFDTLTTTPHGAEIIAPLEWHGVITLGDSAVNLRARIKTKPGQQWAVGRAYTALVKKALDRAGVEIPFPHRELKLPKEMLEVMAPKRPSRAVEAGPE
ncbi:MAG: mechanosensitive ion channel domain-containing protein [Pseudomonadota bacterium]